MLARPSPGWGQKNKRDTEGLSKQESARLSELSLGPCSQQRRQIPRRRAKRHTKVVEQVAGTKSLVTPDLGPAPQGLAAPTADFFVVSLLAPPITDLVRVFALLDHFSGDVIVVDTWSRRVDAPVSGWSKIKRIIST